MGRLLCRVQVWQILRQDMSVTRLAVQDTLLQLLERSLESAASITHHPASCGARFRLLTLALHLCQFGRGGGGRMAALYDQVLFVALDWFATPTQPYQLSPESSRQAGFFCQCMISRQTRACSC